MAQQHATATTTLDEAIKQAGGAVNLLRRSNLGPYTFPVIPAEFTNWRDEQRAWKETCGLLELSYHMTELHLRGPGALPFLSKMAVNKFDTFPVNRAKQLVLAAHDGYMIGDAIVFRERDAFFRVVGAPFASDWLQFNATMAAGDMEVSRDDNFAIRTGTRDVFRLQIQGPLALSLMQDVTGGTLPDIKFFDIGEFEIAGKAVRALRHGMTGEPGFEIYGRWEDQHVVREALVRTGERHGLSKIGALAYSTTAQESGWMPMPLPAIYEGTDMKPYREWLTTDYLETIGSLGGSFVSDDIKEYYVDPIEVGYGSLIDFRRDFLGRDALLKKAQSPTRKKVTLVWNNDDVADTIKSSLFQKSSRNKFIALPNPMYATFQYDAILKNDKVVGTSQWLAYSSNATSIISLALIDIESSAPGTEVSLLWGEPDTLRRTVEKHEPREIRATVAPSPYYEKRNRG